MRLGGKVWGQSFSCRFSVFVIGINFFLTCFLPVGKSFAGALQANTEAHSHALLTLLYIMALSWIEHEKVRYDSASRAHCTTALRLHMERGLKAGSRLPLNCFSLVSTHIAAGDHRRSTTNTDMESPPHTYCHVESSEASFQGKHKWQGRESFQNGNKITTGMKVQTES